MSKLSREEVLKLARLARLSLTDDEVERYRVELSNIIEYIDLLNEADVEGLKPTSQVTGLVNVFRADEVVESVTTPEELLELAPDRGGDYIKVKRMI